MAKNRSAASMDLAAWVDSLQSQGSYTFTREKALEILKISQAAFKLAAARLAKKKRICRVHGGFFIIIPLEYFSTGVLPPEWFIADLMSYIEQPYYAGLLSAAVLHGAAHQQPQQFQVVTTRPLREIRRTSLALKFFSKKSLPSALITKVKVQTGYISVSTPEGTALDLIRYSRSIGGLDRVITVLQELGERMDPSRIVDAAKADGNSAYVQRLGWLLEKAGYPELTEKLGKWIEKQQPFIVKLEPSLPSRGAVKDSKWNLIVNASVEGDL